jgi:hypothetical protein
VDDACFGGDVRPANEAKDRVDRGRAESQTGKRQVAVVLRERGGETLPGVFKAEGQAVCSSPTSATWSPSAERAPVRAIW